MTTKKSAVQQLQSRIAKRQNELRYIEEDIAVTRAELSANQEPGFYHGYLVNHLKWAKQDRKRLADDQALDKTLQRGMTLLGRTQRKHAKLRKHALQATIVVLDNIKQKVEALS